MASIKDLKKRIGTVKNTQQTTRAMKMVSAAKLRRAQEAIHESKSVCSAIGELIQASRSDELELTESSPLVQEAISAEGAKKKVLLVVVTSDRGLCGGFNSNVIKGDSALDCCQCSSYESVKLAFVGRKAHDFFKTRK